MIGIYVCVGAKVWAICWCCEKSSLLMRPSIQVSHLRLIDTCSVKKNGSLVSNETKPFAHRLIQRSVMPKE